MPDPENGPAPIPPTQPSAPLRRLFYGREGLRAPWSVVLFIVVVLFTTIIVLKIIDVGSPILFGSPNIANIASVDPYRMGPGLTALSSYPFVVGVLVATIVMARSEHRSPWSYGLARPHALGLFAAGAGWGFVALSVLIGLLAITGHITVSSPANPPLVSLQFAAKWAVAILGGGLFEELAARGYLQDRLSRATGFWPAAVRLSILFGAGHYLNSGETVIGVVGAGTIGLVFSYSLWRSGSLWWAIGFHTAWHWAQSYFYGTRDGGTGSAGALFTSEPVGAHWLSGGTVGPEGSALVFVVLIGVVLVVRRTLTPPSPSPSSTVGTVATART